MRAVSKALGMKAHVNLRGIVKAYGQSLHRDRPDEKSSGIRYRAEEGNFFSGDVAKHVQTVNYSKRDGRRPSCPYEVFVALASL